MRNGDYIIRDIDYVEKEVKCSSDKNFSFDEFQDSLDRAHIQELSDEINYKCWNDVPRAQKTIDNFVKLYRGVKVRNGQPSLYTRFG
jgi:hypothetical protein